MSDERPSRPDPLPVNPSEIPSHLKSEPQWVCWRYKPERNEWTKVPIDAETGDYASTTDSDTWTTFESVIDYHNRTETNTDGVGYVITEDDPIVGGDLDDCRDPETDQISDWAVDIISCISTYTEVSPSGTGIRSFGFGSLPADGNRGDIPDHEGHLELYETGRYLTVTGHILDEASKEVRQVSDHLSEIHAKYIGGNENDRTPDDVGKNETLDTIDIVQNVQESDENYDLTQVQQRIVQKAKAAENGEKFKRLWKGDSSLWAGEGGEYPSQSEADEALCEFFVFWSDKLKGDPDPQLIDKLFRQSGLMRSKWDEDRGDRTYGERTIETAIQHYRSDENNEDAEQRENNRDLVSPTAIADVPDYAALAAHVSDINKLPEPLQVAGLMGFDGPKALKSTSSGERAYHAWRLLQPHLDLLVSLPDETIFQYNDGIWTPDGRQVLREAGAHALKSHYSKSVLRELTEIVATTHGVRRDDLGVPTEVVAVENGLLNLHKAANEDANVEALRPLEPEDYALVQLPVEYNPNAQYEEWEEYVKEWAEDGMADALQEYVGYCLHIGEMPIHRALLIVGGGANGKSAFLQVVRALLGEGNTTSIELQKLANGDYGLADFNNSLANIDDDLSSRKLGSGIGMFKKLVAGNRVRARQPYKQAFEYNSTGKHLYAANQVPDVSNDVGDDDEAFWRRWLLVEFPQYYQPSERDPDLVDKLTEPEQLSGVLNWAIDGWERLLEQESFTGEEQFANQKRERWQSWGDSVDKFIAKCVESDADADNKTTTGVYDQYTAWCKENGEEPVGQQQFTNTIKKEDVGYTTSVRVDGTPQRGYKSLGLPEESL